MDATEGVRSSKPGPHTPEGRAAVALNALSHGLRSERPVVPSESPEEWDSFLAATLESLAPRDPLQLALARRAALALWRLERVTRYETQRLREEGADFPPDDVLARVQRYESHLFRQYQGAVRELRALQSLRPRPTATPGTAEQSPRPHSKPKITERTPTPPPPPPPASDAPPQSAEQSRLSHASEARPAPAPPLSSQERGEGVRSEPAPAESAEQSPLTLVPSSVSPGRAANEAYWRREAELVACASRNRRVAIRDEDLCDASQAFSHELALDDPDSIIILDGEELPRTPISDL